MPRRKQEDAWLGHLTESERALLESPLQPTLADLFYLARALADERRRFADYRARQSAERAEKGTEA